MSGCSSTAGSGGGGGGGGTSATATGAAAATLRLAASTGDVDTCTNYLSNVKCVRFTRDELGQSALHLAASGGHSDVVRVLLNVAAPREIDTPDGSGCTALQRAATHGHDELLKLLLSRGADANRQDNIQGNSALHEAACRGYSRTVRLLAAAGAKLSLPNSAGFTALHLCCQHGHNQACRELLLAGCATNAQNNYGDTALHTAARYGHAGVTRILISAECRPSDANKNGDTALHIAAAMGRRKLTRILLQASCDRAVRNKQGETARDIARRKDLLEICRILDETPPMKQQQPITAAQEKRTSTKPSRSKSKVRFDAKSPTREHQQPQSASPAKSKQWSPYGCHYYPDPETFPEPRLDSLPQEPLRRGEQYYLDLAGNICKGPVGVGFTCYCAPLFQHLQARLEKDKRELQRAHMRLGHKVAGLEQKIARGLHGRRSERVNRNLTTNPYLIAMSSAREVLPKARSLEEIQKYSLKQSMQSHRSMDELEPRPVPHHTKPTSTTGGGYKSEDSSDDDDRQRPTVPLSMPNYENIVSSAPRSRVGLYSPTVNVALVEGAACTLPSGGGEGASDLVMMMPPPTSHLHYYSGRPSTSKDNYLEYHHRSNVDKSKLMDSFSARFAKLRVLDSSCKQQPQKVVAPEPQCSLEADDDADDEGLGGAVGATRTLNSTAKKLFDKNCAPKTVVVPAILDSIDRDTNNDSGYSTKVYGSSKGNSPSLSGGQVESSEYTSAGSLV